MIWCKVALSALLVGFVSASLAEQGGEHYNDHLAAPNQKPIEVGHAHDAHEDGHDHDGHHCAQQYKFGYKIIDKYGNKQVREEESDEHNNRKGYYSFLDHDGVHRKVEYVADGHGFRASIITNEAGTASSHPAAAKIISQPTKIHRGHDGESLLDARSDPIVSKVAPAAHAAPAPLAAVSHREVLSHGASIAHVAHLNCAIDVPHSGSHLQSTACAPRVLAAPYGYAGRQPQFLPSSGYPAHSANEIVPDYPHSGAQHAAQTVISQASYVRPAYYAAPYGKISAVTGGYRGQKW